MIGNHQVTDSFSRQRKGLTERELNEKCLELLKEEGFSGPSFDPITAYGKGAADPHHVTDDSKGKRGDCVVLDIGGMWQNYASDTTRTVSVFQACDILESSLSFSI